MEDQAGDFLKQLAAKLELVLSMSINCCDLLSSQLGHSCSEFWSSSEYIENDVI